MRRIVFAVVFLSLAVPTLTSAQGVLVISQNKCQLDKQSAIRAFADSATIPIAQELVNEGKLWAAGTAYHAWGDEWNVVNWYNAETMSGFLEAFSELISRINARYPTAIADWQSWCFEHKDSMYSHGRMTTAPPGM
ncbi:MAG: hypothetical protein OER90_15340 [Gemmatimonadota bacterium]|nr:hypothetical protein [Gemmatimonadota bacterium]